MSIMNKIAANAKARLIAAVDAKEATYSSGNLTDQAGVMGLDRVREAIASMSRVNAYKLEKAIMNKEYYDPSADKWGFGPVVVNPSNYLSFCADAGVPLPVVKETEELSRSWYD